jgi:N-acetylglutamate synthase-like GNAT family acetyltransferase
MEIRRATISDVPALRALIDLSVRELQAPDYSRTQIEGALGTVFGVDSLLIADGTYFVVEADGEIVGCGGWSKRKTLFGSDQGPGREPELLDARQENARIRAFFVHPQWARKGIGSLILETCENAAAAEGFRGFELGATLTGERLYAVRGYVPVEHVAVQLPNGESLPIIRMVKNKVGPSSTPASRS